MKEISTNKEPSFIMSKKQTHRWSVSLTHQQRLQLQEARDHHSEPYVRERSAAILKIAEGDSPHWVARHGLLKPRDPDTVYRWLKQYLVEGLPGLLAHQQGGAVRRRL